MASRVGRRIFATALRSASRPAFRQSGHAAARRGMSSSGAHEHGSSSSDTPWMIASGVVFIPTILYLLSPYSKAAPHQAHAASGHGEPHTPDETVVSQKVESEPEPAPEAASGEVVKDDEGTAVPVEEIKESIARAVTDDSPKEAIQAEAMGSVPAESSTPYDNGAPGQTSDAESEWEQVDKPERGAKTGTVQGEGASGPTDLGDAREKSKQGQQPKQAAEDQ